jgi:hypothetical protein
MKQCLYIVLIFTAWAVTLSAQDRLQRPAGNVRGGFSLSGRNAALVADTLSVPDSASSVRRISAFRLTSLGDFYAIPMDTGMLNLANRTLVEGQSTAIAYTGNVASPAQSRIFRERNDDRQFIFANPFDPYIITPANGTFYDAKLPYSNVFYTRAGGSLVREEQLKVLLTSNFGRKLNVGGEFDYIYGRGHYPSNNNKVINYRFFATYRSDRYEAAAHLRNANIVNSENGGLTNDRYVTHPDDFSQGRRKVDTRSFPTRFTNTWNRVRGTDVFLTHRYNLGFYREMTEKESELKRQKEEAREARMQEKARAESERNDRGENSRRSDAAIEAPPPPPVEVEEEEEEEDIHANEVFVPVSSIVHTFEYENNRRRFISNYSAIDTCYANRFGMVDSLTNDLTSAWTLRNTLALSLREGFHEWMKFGLTAYVLFEQRQFTLPGDSVVGQVVYDEYATSLGAELSKRQGEILTYRARGELCLLGNDLGRFQIEGDIQTRFPLFGKTATIRAEGSLRNLVPAFYLRHHHGRFFWWDTNPKNIRRQYVGGTVEWESSRTQISLGAENIRNHIFFNQNGFPEQYGGNLQVITGRLKQDFRYKALGWDNELVYQLSSNPDLLPLPQLSAYTNLYVTFKVAKVLSLQLGADLHYHTAYYAPYYEPATQQFQVQDQLKIGNYPLLNAYVNCHLKQTCFFVSGYNLGSLLIDHPAAFSMPHYPLNPMVVKLGLAVTFNN